MQVDDEDDIDIGGSEEVSIEIKSEIDNGKQNTKYEVNQISFKLFEHNAHSLLVSRHQLTPKVDRVMTSILKI